MMNPSRPASQVVDAPTKVEILNHYIHVDNGGYTFKITAHDNGDAKHGLPHSYFTNGLEVSSSFFGYLTTSINMNDIGPKELRELAMKFIAAADAIDKLNKEET